MCVLFDTIDSAVFACFLVLFATTVLLAGVVRSCVRSFPPSFVVFLFLLTLR